MKLNSPTTLAALALTLLTSSAFCADDIVRRIDHPNGPATYVTAPAENRSYVSGERRGGTTIGVYAGERSVGARDQAPRVDAGGSDSDSRATVAIHLGRGQTQYVPVQR